MRRWILAMTALAFVAVGTVMADPCKTPCGKAQMNACGQMPGCGAMAKMSCGEMGGNHATHDPDNIWYRGPAPQHGLFDCMKEGRRHHGRGCCGNHGGPGDVLRRDEGDGIRRSDGHGMRRTEGNGVLRTGRQVRWQAAPRRRVGHRLEALLQGKERLL